MREAVSMIAPSAPLAGAPPRGTSPVARRGPGGQGMGRASEPPACVGESTAPLPPLPRRAPRSLRLGWPLAASAASTRRRSAREALTGDSRVRVRPSARQSHVTYGVVLGVLVVDVGAVVLAQVEGRVGEKAVHRLAAPENVHLRPG